MDMDRDRRATPNGRPGPRRGARAVAGIGLLGILAALAWFCWQAMEANPFDGRGGLTARLRISRDVPPEGRRPGDPFIGSRACAECHPGEYALYTGSGHAHTFAEAETRSLTDRLAGQSVPDPEIPGVRWSFAKRNGRFEISRSAEGQIRRFVVDYALGSGHHATTFVSVLKLDPPRLLEHRLTFFTKEGELGITPGQARDNPKLGTTPLGCEMAARESIKCFGCHATELSGRDSSELDPPTMIPGVSCERCHGPARAHVEAARSGTLKDDLQLERDTGRWSVHKQLEFCGRCHRHPSRVSPDLLNPEDPLLARFQPIGLSQSRCFQASDAGLSCVSCHDPHGRSSSDPAAYEAVCLRCHGGTADRTAADSPDNRPTTPAGSCTVSPSSGCVECHMPRVDSGQHVLFTDHWIRVRPRPSP